MPFEIESTHFGAVHVIQPRVFGDPRGFFMEVYSLDQFNELGITDPFVQDNHSSSEQGVVRGLHFQWDPPQSKLIRVTRGTAMLVAVDIRKGSPTVGQWLGVEASSDNRKMVYAPAGFATGFCVLDDLAEIQYKCTGVYNPAHESGIRWDDPAIGIDWPVKDALLSEKDVDAQTLAEWLERPESEHFRYA